MMPSGDALKIPTAKSLLQNNLSLDLSQALVPPGTTIRMDTDQTEAAKYNVQHDKSKQIEINLGEVSQLTLQ